MLDEALREAVAPAVRHVSLAAAAVHFKDSPARDLHLVESGRARLMAAVADRAILLEEIGPGEPFGGAAEGEGDALETWIETGGETLEALVLSKEALAGIERRTPAVAIEIHRARAAAAERRMARLRAALADRAKLEQDFLVHIAHDLRAPLLILGSGLDELLGRPEKYGALAGPQERILRRLRQNGTFLRRLVDEIVEVAESETTAVRRDATTLAECFTDLVPQVIDRRDAGGLAALPDPTDYEVFRAGLTAFRLALEIDPPAALHAPMRVDRLRLVRVLANIVGNAFKFTAGTVAVRLRRTADALEADIVDQGAGIPEEIRAIVFDRMRQSEASAGAPCGSGLGLSAARQIVESIGGTISAGAGDGGVGTRITIRVPLPNQR